MRLIDQCFRDPVLSEQLAPDNTMVSNGEITNEAVGFESFRHTDDARARAAEEEVATAPCSPRNWREIAHPAV